MPATRRQRSGRWVPGVAWVELGIRVWMTKIELFHCLRHLMLMGLQISCLCASCRQLRSLGPSCYGVQELDCVPNTMIAHAFCPAHRRPHKSRGWGWTPPRCATARASTGATAPPPLCGAARWFLGQQALTTAQLLGRRGGRRCGGARRRGRVRGTTAPAALQLCRGRSRSGLQQRRCSTRSCRSGRHQHWPASWG